LFEMAARGAKGITPFVGLTQAALEELLRSFEQASA